MLDRPMTTRSGAWGCRGTRTIRRTTATRTTRATDLHPAVSDVAHGTARGRRTPPLARTSLYLPNVSDRFLESVPCNICGTIESHVLQPAQYDIDSLKETDFARTFSSSSDERLKHQLVACAACGLQY